MKIDPNYPTTAPKVFQPFVLPLLIETAEQAAAMHAIFNHADLIRFLGSSHSGCIRDYIREKAEIKGDNIQAFAKLEKLLK